MKTRAAVLYDYQTPLKIEEVDLEDPKEREVLVQFKSAGLCHSDLSVINGVLKPPTPIVPGHEGAGIVKKVGAGVSRVQIGDHVVLLWVPVCGQCYYCRKGETILCELKDKIRSGTMIDNTYRMRNSGGQGVGKMGGVGSFSEYNVVNQENLLVIDKDIPFEVAAIAGCALITGVGAVLNKAKVKPGSSVAVVGCGGVGLNVIQGAVLVDAGQIIAVDILDHKLDMAEQFGATHTINSSTHDPISRVMEITGQIGVDYAFEALGTVATAKTAFGLIRRGGSMIMVGIPAKDEEFCFPLAELPLMDKSICGSYYGSGEVASDIKAFLELYKKGRLKLDELITGRYRIQDINQGMKDLETGKNARGVILYE
jgi:S-(hydroxymethyl)glutathione dehydrogenase/alcohol dehydrogenase